MKALTIRQPWASLIALGVKTIETRSWPTNYRGPVLIHAGKAKPPKKDSVVGGWQVYQYGNSDQWAVLRCADAATYCCDFGAVVAVADLIDCVEFQYAGQLPGWLNVSADKSMPRYIGADQLPYGDFTPGRFGWLLRNVRPVGPIPAKGKQGLWTPDADLLGSTTVGSS